MKKKLVCVLLMLVLMLSILPMAIYAEDTAITSVSITVKNPAVGGKTTDTDYKTATVDAEAPYTVKSVAWSGGSGSWLGAPDFVQGKSYTATVKLTPKTGYKFVKDSINAITINGETGQLKSVNADGSAEFKIVLATTGTGNVTLTFRELMYSGVKLTAGSSIPGSFSVYSESSRYNYKAQAVGIYYNGNPVTSGTLEKGKTYALDVKFTADANCVFSDNHTARLIDYDIHGEQMEHTGATATFRFTFVAKEEIREASINFTKPLGGRELSFDYSLPENSPVKVLSVHWEFEDENGDYVIHKSTDETPVYAETGKEYTFYVYIGPNEGYAFPTNENNLTFLMNGERVRRTAHGGAGRWGYGAKVVAAVDPNPTTKPTTIPTTSSSTTSATTKPSTSTSTTVTTKPSTSTTVPTTQPTTVPTTPTSVTTTVPTTEPTSVPTASTTVSSTTQLTTTQSEQTTLTTTGSDAPTAPTTPAADNAEQGSGSDLLWLWIVLGVVAVGGIVFFVIFGKKKKEQ